MKWGDSWKVSSWDSLLKALLVIIAVIVIVGMLVDFVSWRDALNFVKQKIPISGTAYKWIRGFGYVPLLWRGRFERIYMVDYKNSTRLDLTDNILFQFNGHNQVCVNLTQSGKAFYGNWNATQAALDYIKEKRDGWEKIAQPFGTYCEVYVEVNYEKNTLFILVVGEDRIFIRQFKCKVGGGNCGGGYTTLYWP